jgi:hypothetical protein
MDKVFFILPSFKHHYPHFKNYSSNREKSTHIGQMSLYFALFRLEMGENALKNAVFWVF